MPDLFDNFFGRIGATLNGGKTPYRFSSGAQVNTGRYYNYHENTTNNKYWMPAEKAVGQVNPDLGDTLGKIEDTQYVKPRMGSVTSMELELKSRNSSISE